MKMTDCFKCAALILALLFVFLAGLAVGAPGTGYSNLQSDDDTTAIWTNQYNFWHGMEASGRPTTPTTENDLTYRAGPAWLKSVECALTGNLRWVGSFTLIGGDGVDYTTSATKGSWTGGSGGARLTAARLPATLTIQAKLSDDGGSLPMVWLDGWTSTTAWPVSYHRGATELGHPDVATSLGLNVAGNWSPQNKNPASRSGILKLVATITTNTLDVVGGATTAGIEVKLPQGTFLSTAYARPTSATIIIRKP